MNNSLSGWYIAWHTLDDLEDPVVNGWFDFVPRVGDKASVSQDARFDEGEKHVKGTVLSVEVGFIRSSPNPGKRMNAYIKVVVQETPTKRKGAGSSPACRDVR